jgi:hypothetical protein
MLKAKQNKIISEFKLKPVVSIVNKTESHLESTVGSHSFSGQILANNSFHVYRQL